MTCYRITIEGNRFTLRRWENFILMEEAPTSVGTMHTTHGILIQEVQPQHWSTIIESSVPRTKQRSMKRLPSEQLPTCFIQKHVEPILLPLSLSAQNDSFALQDLIFVLCRAIHNNNYTVRMAVQNLCMPVKQQPINGILSPLLHPITKYPTVQQSGNIYGGVKKTQPEIHFRDNGPCICETGV